MMSKTHLSVGMAAALAVSPITNVNTCLLALAGGAIGGVIADVDILDNDYESDALTGELIALGITVIFAIVDFFSNGGVCNYVVNNSICAIIGAIGFFILWIIGYNCDHRKFTHSLLALVLFSLCVALIYPELGVAFAFGYFSHLLLDILNKKGIQLLFPLKIGICLKLCYASKFANKLFMILGFIAIPVLIIGQVIS